MISDLLVLQYPKWRPEIMENYPKCHAPAAQHGVQVVGVPDMQLAERQGRVWEACSVPPNQELVGFCQRDLIFGIDATIPSSPQTDKKLVGKEGELIMLTKPVGNQGRGAGNGDQTHGEQRAGDQQR